MVVLEYVERGEIKWRDSNNRPKLTLNQIRPMMRDVVVGLEYLHFQGIIHRDIKPGNLLIANDGTVKISDFGVSHLAKMDEAGNLLPENDLDLAKTAGSPAFFAPELCQFDTGKPRAPITKAIDVWALGITFYCLLFGREPFPDVYGEMQLFHRICNDSIEPPNEYLESADADALNLLRRFLTKSVNERIHLYQVRRHSFMTKDLPNPQEWIESTDITNLTTLEVTPQEVETAVSSFSNIVRRTLQNITMTAKRSMSYLRQRGGSGKIITGTTSLLASPVIPDTVPMVRRSDPRTLNAGEKSPGVFKSDININRPKAPLNLFASVAKTEEIPPTPPHSSKIENVVPNGASTYGTNVARAKAPAQPLTPPLVVEGNFLNDDYSNLCYEDYYSDSEESMDYGEEDEEEREESDEEDRLEMKGSIRRPRK